MSNLFNALCTQLKIDPSQPSAHDLDQLINWCQTHISTDIYLDGESQERFNFYKDLASNFLEQVLPNIHADDLTSPVPDFDNMSALQFVVDMGLDRCLKNLNPTDYQVNIKVNRMTLLQLAVAQGYLHTTEALLSLGANLEEKTINGAPILFKTLMLPIAHDQKMKQNKQVIYGLLSSLSEELVHQRNEAGDTILHIMSIYGYDELIKTLLTDAPHLVSIANHLGHYPIFSAILNAQHLCVTQLIAVDGVEQLVDAKGRNALHYASRYGDDEMMKICLDSVLPKDARDKMSQSPLMLAVIAGNIDAVKNLIACDVQINMTDDRNRCALHYAVELNHVKIVKLLLAAPDIDVNITDTDGHKPFDLVQMNTENGTIIRKLLVDKGASN